MAKVTSKLQLTVPKVIADVYGIKPGDQLDWTAAGDVIRVIPAKSRRSRAHLRSVEERLKLFDQATARQRRREAEAEEVEIPAERPPKPREIERGWRREDLYTRGRSR
ncbi:MAG: AbrB/MazE/SpoVT family DNA-binding domain-containing protein [Terriglobia bacterium]|jgi:AbrB family looped-hinge helix DNA binding protein